MGRINEDDRDRDDSALAHEKHCLGAIYCMYYENVALS